MSVSMIDGHIDEPKKLTDNEIIKTLECCKKATNYEDCKNCYYVKCTNPRGCYRELLNDVLDLINRQKKEIERLKVHNTAFAVKNSELEYDLGLLKQEKSVIKSAAYKEFAEGLMKKFDIKGFTWFEIEEKLFIEEVNNLLKEMEGAEE